MRLCAHVAMPRAPINESAMPTEYAMLSTYPPTQCGLATFSAALLAHLPEPGDNVGVVRVLDGPTPRNSPLIVHDLMNGSAASAADAVGVIDDFDVAIVQHEYGIYGGHDGADLIPLLTALTVPSIVVLHTVLADPTDHQRMVLDEVIAAADTVVTMTQTGRSRVLDMYGTSPDKVFVIPHGAAGTLAARSASHRRPGGPRVLTWGLLGPGKGIEHAIEAVALLRDDGLRVDYTVAGQTHPRVRARSGEAYRQSLQALARVRGVAGLLVERKDPASIAAALRSTLTEPGLSGQMSRHAADIAPQLLWPAVAACYRELTSALTRTPAGAALWAAQKHRSSICNG